MNQKVLKVALVAAIALVSGINVFNAQKSETLSDIALANVKHWLMENGMMVIVSGVIGSLRFAMKMDRFLWAVLVGL